MKELLINFTPANMTIMMIGAAIYFFAEFKTKRDDTSFSFKVWLDQNLINIPITILGVAAYFMISESITRTEAFAIGLTPNLIVDWVGDFMRRKKIA